MSTTNQNLNLQPKPSQQLALNESAESRSRLDEMLLGCFALQKIYGRDPGALKAIVPAFHAVLGGLPAHKVMLALQTWMQRSQEFPTPADIVSLVKRNGRPPLKESDVIAVRKKEPEIRTRADWTLLEEWEAQQSDGWSDYRYEAKNAATLEENIRLRSQVKQLTDENKRLAGLLHEARIAKGLEKPSPTMQDKVTNTIAEMKRTGARQEDIEAFAAEHGIAA